MNFINIYRNLLYHLIFVHILLLEDYEQGPERKVLIFAPFLEQFKTASLRKSYW